MIFKAGLYDSAGTGIIESTDLTIKIKRDSDGYFYDFDDDTFKVIDHTTLSAIMIDVDINKVPGEYEYHLDISNWDDGIFTYYIIYIGSPSWTSTNEFQIINGDLAFIAGSISDSIITNIQDKVDESNTKLNTLLKYTSGIGAIKWIYTIVDTVNNPIADVDVWISTDEDGNNVIASGKTNQYGEVTFWLDAGTVYVWRQKSGWNFINPDIEVVE